MQSDGQASDVISLALAIVLDLIVRSYVNVVIIPMAATQLVVAVIVNQDGTGHSVTTVRCHVACSEYFSFHRLIRCYLNNSDVQYSRMQGCSEENDLVLQKWIDIQLFASFCDECYNYCIVTYVAYNTLSCDRLCNNI